MQNLSVIFRTSTLRPAHKPSALHALQSYCNIIGNYILSDFLALIASLALNFSKASQNIMAIMCKYPPLCGRHKESPLHSPTAHHPPTCIVQFVFLPSEVVLKQQT